MPASNQIQDRTRSLGSHQIPLTVLQFHTHTMPNDPPDHDQDDGIDIEPGTNEARIIKHLYSNPHLKYNPAELQSEFETPRGDIITTLDRLLNDGHIGKTSDGSYHALETRDDLRRFASALIQVERMFENYDDDSLNRENAEQTKPRSEQIEEHQKSQPTDAEVEQDLNDLEAIVDAELDEHQEDVEEKGFDAEAWAEHAIEPDADQNRDTGKEPYPDTPGDISSGFPDDDEELDIDEEHTGTDEWKVEYPEDYLEDERFDVEKWVEHSIDSEAEQCRNTSDGEE